jgi:hypothetical protein
MEFIFRNTFFLKTLLYLGKALETIFFEGIRFKLGKRFWKCNML